MIDKENGGKADALNAAHEPGARTHRLLHGARLAAGARRPSAPRPPRSLRIRSGWWRWAEPSASPTAARSAQARWSGSGIPRNFLALLQTVEYLRAFLMARLAWSEMGSSADHIRRLRPVPASALRWRSAASTATARSARTWSSWSSCTATSASVTSATGSQFVPDPVCWTEAPETMRQLSRQRRRWQRGLGETLWRHRAVAGNGRYGALGTAAVPYFLLFEFLGPLIELLRPAADPRLVGSRATSRPSSSSGSSWSRCSSASC